MQDPSGQAVQSSLFGKLHVVCPHPSNVQLLSVHGLLSSHKGGNVQTLNVHSSSPQIAESSVQGLPSSQHSVPSKQVPLQQEPLQQVPAQQPQDVQDSDGEQHTSLQHSPRQQASLQHIAANGCPQYVEF